MKTAMAVLSLCVAACGGAAVAPAAPASGSGGGSSAMGEPAATPASEAPGGASVSAPTAPGATSVDQVSLGQKLYTESCSKCHGAGGEGKGRAPALVGKGVLPLEPRAGSKRNVQFKTVADVFRYAKSAMPPEGAGTLSEDQYWAILAFDLKANGIDLGGKTLDGALAAKLDIPR